MFDFARVMRDKRPLLKTDLLDPTAIAVLPRKFDHNLGREARPQKLEACPQPLEGVKPYVDASQVA